jgi:hypothetical protein
MDEKLPEPTKLILEPSKLLLENGTEEMPSLAYIEHQDSGLYLDNGALSTTIAGNTITQTKENYFITEVPISLKSADTPDVKDLEFGALYKGKTDNNLYWATTTGTTQLGDGGGPISYPLSAPSSNTPQYGFSDNIDAGVGYDTKDGLYIQIAENKKNILISDVDGVQINNDVNLGTNDMTCGTLYASDIAAPANNTVSIDGANMTDNINCANNNIYSVGKLGISTANVPENNVNFATLSIRGFQQGVGQPGIEMTNNTSENPCMMITSQSFDVQGILFNGYTDDYSQYKRSEPDYVPVFIKYLNDQLIISAAPKDTKNSIITWTDLLVMDLNAVNINVVANCNAGVILPTVDGIPTNLSYYEEYNNDIEWTGPFTASANIKITRVGKSVTVNITGLLGRATAAAAFTSSGAIPSRFRTGAQILNWFILTRINNTHYTGLLILDNTTGDLTIYHDQNSSLFHNNQTAQFHNTSISYTL